MESHAATERELRGDRTAAARLAARRSSRCC